MLEKGQKKAAMPASSNLSISSLQHPLIKYLVKLREDRSSRVKNQSVLISGIKLVTEMSKTHPIKRLLVNHENAQEYHVPGNEIILVSYEILRKVTGLPNPEPLAAEIALPAPCSLGGKKSLLILDGLSDPGNVGTLFRSAVALGWEGIFLTTGSTDPFNEKALRAAKGATFKIPFQEGSYEALNTLLKENSMDLFIADIEGELIESFVPPSSFALVLGNESHGVSQTLKQSGQKIRIKMHNMESLNVSAAGAILMHLFKKG